MAGLEARPAAEAAGPRLLPGSSCGSCSGASGAAVPSPPGQPGLPCQRHGEAEGKGSHGEGWRMSGGCWSPQGTDSSKGP